MQIIKTSLNFSENPLIIAWELTRSCALKCVHCRAEAIDKRDPQELSTKQAFEFLSEMRQFGSPILVLTGGDPLRRPDLFEIVEFAANLGLHVAITPSGTQEVTYPMLSKLKESGIERIAVSLDGPCRRFHDAFRGVDGSFTWTIQILRWASELNIPIQINTTVTRRNLGELEKMAALIDLFDVALWSVFFLIPVGRGLKEELPDAREFEQVFQRLFQLSKNCSFDLKTTEAPHYRRFVLQQLHSNEKIGAMRMRATNDGKGFVFISHTGEIQPSGFLPLSAGNVKKDSIVNVYRNSLLFKQLRNSDLLEGKCGVCEFKSICGGSRARAYALSGNYLAEEPCCDYQPRNYGEKTE